ncbi:hypothetical protein ACN47E_003895 [Coniothyrium glycines]
MPALRKSARERDFRSQHHRSSTTPYASPTGTPGDSHTEKKQRSITEWTEPQPQTLAPSFEEHGFVRHGVLENMAALGVPPRAKDKQRARALGEPPLRQSLAGKGDIMLGEDVTSTPEVTPGRELEHDDMDRQEGESMQADLPIFDEDEDDDYRPIKTKKKAKASKTPIRGKTPVQNKTPVQGKSPLRNGHSKTTPVSASPAVQAIQAAPPEEANAQRIFIAVNDAIARANKEDPRIGIALRRMHEESKGDTELVGIMESVIFGTSTPAQAARFKAFIRHVKKEEKRKMLLAGQKKYNQSAAFDGDEAFSNQQPSPRASSEVVPDDSVSTVHDLRYQQAPAPSSSEPVESFTRSSHRASQSAIDKESAQPPSHPFSSAPNLSVADQSGAPMQRMSSKSPRKRHIASSNQDPEAMDVDGGVSTTVPTPMARTPDTGQSDSELSEVNEEIVQKGPPESALANGKSSNAASTVSQKKVKSTTVARAAKQAKGKNNVGKLFGKHAHKAQPPTAEQLAEEERVWDERQRMAEQQLLRQLGPYNPPVSDVRFDDEILETESLTESQIAVGPPVDSNQPRRAGRKPESGTKRLREDGSRFSSPQLDLGAASRPSTPAVGPAPKRLKLTNGQAARTKRSPVKNRDAGPVAGVPFIGGGGSRQLGPDDNDPNSPQSESDDFCAACRGAGEFVCCETCPRVFHLLCCDPPRVEVPDGAFYCHECNAKLPPPDDSQSESYLSLQPLFKALERTNPRAFALPEEIQNIFEGVSARKDGSYFEEVKKFPLAKNSGYGYQRPDYTRVVDAEQKVILCTQCGLSSGHKRQMLKCDFCHAYWHLDCVDPPLANPPHISLEASQRDAWRCPRHFEHDLRSGLLLQQDLNEPVRDAEMSDAAPGVPVARKVRMRKQPDLVEPTFSRGMRNNGLIDIINDSDDDTDGEGNYVFNPDDPKDLNSKIFRVPEKGVILDFVSKVKSARVVKERRAEDTAAQRKASMQKFLAHSIQQQHAALALAGLSQKHPDLDLGEGKIAALIYGLTAEAPPEVITAISNAAPPPLSEGERAQLLKLQQLIQLRLRA